MENTKRQELICDECQRAHLYRRTRTPEGIVNVMIDSCAVNESAINRYLKGEMMEIRYMAASNN